MPHSWRADDFGKVVFDYAHHDQISYEHPHRHQVPRHSGIGKTIIAQFRQKLIDVSKRKLFHVGQTMVSAELIEFVQITAIRQQGILRQPAFDREVIQEPLQKSVNRRSVCPGVVGRNSRVGSGYGADQAFRLATGLRNENVSILGNSKGYSPYR